jgi:predicted RNA-binding Zn-ribbon protein involved in translation (DUF1610 family)
MIISSRTPEGQPFHCPICGKEARIDRSHVADDATCPNCGSLLWLRTRSRSNWRATARQVIARLAWFGLLAGLFLLAFAALGLGVSLLERVVIAVLFAILFGRRLPKLEIVIRKSR